VRVENVEQRFGELGIVVVEFLVDPRRQQRERVEHLLDVRIALTLIGRDKVLRNLRIACGEPSRALPQMRKRAFIPGQ
jgi:hypothetical protein